MNDGGSLWLFFYLPFSFLRLGLDSVWFVSMDGVIYVCTERGGWGLQRQQAPQQQGGRREKEQDLKRTGKFKKEEKLEK